MLSCVLKARCAGAQNHVNVVCGGNVAIWSYLVEVERVISVSGGGVSAELSTHQDVMKIEHH